MAKEVLWRTPDLECFYFSSDVMSVGAYMHFVAAGISVPEQLALAGFNNLNLLRGLPIQLATTDAHRFAIGEAAADIILDDPKQAKLVQLEPEAIRGQSL